MKTWTSFKRPPRSPLERPRIDLETTAAREIRVILRRPGEPEEVWALTMSPAEARELAAALLTTADRLAE